MKQKILFITGSINQTTQMQQIASELPDFDCWFSQIFIDFPPFQWLIDNTQLVSKTVLSGQFKANSEKYCLEHGLRMDYKAKLNHYDLVVYCSDLIIPDRMLQTKTLWVQEGMIDEYNTISKVVKKLHFPPYLAIGTALNGSSNLCDVYCAASEGYKNRFAKIGTDRHKIIVTGIPNFDNCQQFLVNDFPHKNYVLVATTDNRETFEKEDRPAFIRHCVEIAAGRKLIFILHPNDLFERAANEIQEHSPNSTINLKESDINPANDCQSVMKRAAKLQITELHLGIKIKIAILTQIMVNHNLTKD